MSRLLVVEDEPSIAELIEINARMAGHEVTRASNAEQARAAVDQAPPDLVLLDWMLPGMSGLELARHWRLNHDTRHLPIIMLTARAEEDDRLIGLDAGADDYIVKPFSMRELMARIRAVLRRKAPESLETVLSMHGVELNALTHRVSVAGRVVPLGPKEFKLLRVLMARPERVHSREQLLDRVWGRQASIEERTVDVHVKRLREALRPHGSDGLLQTVRGVGYRWSADTPPGEDA